MGGGTTPPHILYVWRMRIFILMDYSCHDNLANVVYLWKKDEKFIFAHTWGQQGGHFWVEMPIFGFG